MKKQVSSKEKGMGIRQSILFLFGIAGQTNLHTRKAMFGVSYQLQGIFRSTGPWDKKLLVCG